MPVLHACSHHASSTDRGARALQRLVEQVSALGARPMAQEGFEGFEREAHELFAEAEREVLGEALERLDADLAHVEIEGQRHHRVLDSAHRYTTAVGGGVQARRTLYRCAGERAVSPMELRAGIVEGHWTPLAAREASRVVAQMTPRSRASCASLGNMAPSKSSLDRLPKGLSARWEARRERFEASLREGTMAPMKDANRAAKREQQRAAGRGAKGPAGYQEAGCATLSFDDAEGKRLDTLYMGRRPEPKKAALKNPLSAELEAALGRRPDLHVVKVADGARDNWSYLDARYGDNDARGRAQFEKLRHVLREAPDGVQKVIRSLDYQRKRFPRRKRIGEVLRYFRRNRHRMRYAHAKARSLPIGSGVVEATCKTLVTQRLKCSAMRWRHAGGQSILTLRALVQSGRFDHASALLSNTYRREVTVPHNVVAFPRQRAA